MMVPIKEMMKEKGGLLILCCMLLSSVAAFSQDTLPNFTVEDKGNGRVIVSWANPYPNLIQIAVQRSWDSLNRFSTVYSSTSPELPVNGYSDKVAPGLRPFYRIFYVMKGGSYYFTKSKRATAVKVTENKVVDSRRAQLDENLLKGITGDQSGGMDFPPDKRFFIKVEDSLLLTLAPFELMSFRDSILQQTKDTLYQLNDDTLSLARYIPPFEQRTSEYVYTDKDGFINIKLPEADKKRYQLTFMEEDGTVVLQLNTLKEPLLILDKANFYHGGWYKFELKENDKIKERNRIFLPRDFSP